MSTSIHVSVMPVPELLWEIIPTVPKTRTLIGAKAHQTQKKTPLAWYIRYGHPCQGNPKIICISIPMKMDEIPPDGSSNF